MGAVGRWGWLQVDCADPARLAGFWAEVLGVEMGAGFGDPVHYLGLEPVTPGGPVMSFQRVPDARTAKNSLHLDIEVDDVDAATERIVSLGGTVQGEDFAEHGFRWRVMTDPEDNEFCLVY